MSRELVLIDVDIDKAYEKMGNFVILSEIYKLAKQSDKLEEYKQIYPELNNLSLLHDTAMEDLVIAQSKKIKLLEELLSFKN